MGELPLYYVIKSETTHGSTYRIEREEWPDAHLTDAWNNVSFSLAGKFYASTLNDETDAFEVIPNQGWHPIAHLTIDSHEFTLAEAATMLGLSPQRVWVLIRGERLPAIYKADVYLLRGIDILEFSMKERPVGRPASSGHIPQARTAPIWVQEYGLAAQEMWNQNPEWRRRAMLAHQSNHQIITDLLSEAELTYGHLVTTVTGPDGEELQVLQDESEGDVK